MGDFDIEKIIALGFGIIIFMFIFLIAIYVVLGIVLNKLNKKIYGKGTALAWIPFCNIYLLGKLTVNKFIGFFLIFVLFITGEYNFSNGNNYVSFVIVPDNMRSIIMMIYSVFVIILFIYAIVKLNKLGKNEESTINEVYLNQKTKQEIMEEDEEIKLVKWDDNNESSTEPKNNVVEESNIPFQNFVNTNTVGENNKSLESVSSIADETPINVKSNADITAEKEIVTEIKHDDIDEEYDYDNPKIQEAIDNIINNSDDDNL